MYRRYLLLVFPLFLLSSILSQTPEPDAVFSRFYLVENSDQGEIALSESRAWVLSDRDRLSLIVEVRDADIHCENSPAFSDHIQVWLGLDKTAFPANFPFHAHPSYLGSFGRIARRGAGEDALSVRMFAPSSEGSRSPGEWVRSVGYPSESDVIRDSLDVPGSGDLRRMRVPYGLVRLAFFVDERRPQLLDRESYSYLEMAFGLEMGDVISPIQYDVDTLEYGRGYRISASIPVESFGFARLPGMSRINLMIGIGDTDAMGQQARLTAFSQKDYDAGTLGSLQSVSLRQPLMVRSPSIPAAFFDAIKWHPSLFYSRSGWRAVEAYAGPLMWKQNMVSGQWSEIRFTQLDVQYDDYADQGFPVQRLTVGRAAINVPEDEQDFFLIDEELFVTSRARNILSEPGGIPKVDVFRLPDGSTGVFVRGNEPHHPYGWGECGICLHETMKLIRTTGEGLRTAAEWFQSEGPETGFRIGEFSFPDFYLSRIDRLRENEIIVLILSHRYLRQQKRVKLTWNAYQGTYDVEVEP